MHNVQFAWEVPMRWSDFKLISHLTRQDTVRCFAFAVNGISSSFPVSDASTSVCFTFFCRYQLKAENKICIGRRTMLKLVLFKFMLFFVLLLMVSGEFRAQINKHTCDGDDAKWNCWVIVGEREKLSLIVAFVFFGWILICYGLFGPFLVIHDLFHEFLEIFLSFLNQKNQCIAWFFWNTEINVFVWFLLCKWRWTFFKQEIRKMFIKNCRIYEFPSIFVTKQLQFSKFSIKISKFLRFSARNLKIPPIFSRFSSSLSKANTKLQRDSKFSSTQLQSMPL